MTSKLKLVFALTFSMILTGCASQMPKMDFTAFNQEKPRSILIPPVINESVDVDAPDYFLSTISLPLSEKGYYVFPVNTVKTVLEGSVHSKCG